MKKPSVLIPQRYHSEIKKLSKAALMDVVWSLCAKQYAGGESNELNEADAMGAFRDEWNAVALDRGDRKYPPANRK